MLDPAVAAAGFDDIEIPDNVGADIDVGVGDRIAHACLRRQMHHAIDAALAKGRGKCAVGGDVGAYHAKIRILRKLGCARFLERNVVIRIEIVEAHDVLAAREQRFCNRKPDESGSSGDKHAHGLRLLAALGGKITRLLRQPPGQSPNSAASLNAMEDNALRIVRWQAWWR